MRRPAALFPTVFALGAIILAPVAVAQPTEITACQTLDQPGAYRLANNLVAASNAICLQITADFVTVDLAGFNITGGGTGIAANFQAGITVRNGSISNFSQSGVNLLGNGFIVEGLNVNCGGSGQAGILLGQPGIVKGNTVTECVTGISATTGTITGNVVNGGTDGIVANQGSTVIGNTVTNTGEFGIFAFCPSNVTDNTALNNRVNLELLQFPPTITCNNTNNVAP